MLAETALLPYFFGDFHNYPKMLAKEHNASIQYHMFFLFFSGCILVEYVNPSCHSRSWKITKKTNQRFSSVFVLEGGKLIQNTKEKY